MTLERNRLGGVNDMDVSALQRAKEADLVTLPESVRGTNCYNCKWISDHRLINHAMCNHPKVKQNVNGRMCCALWSGKGLYTPFKRDVKFK